MRKGRTTLKDYALYKGDEFIDLGNIHELSQRQEISISSLRFYMTPAYKKRCPQNGNRLLLIAID